MKEAVVMTVDMGRSMQLPYSDKMSRSTLSFQCIKLFLQQKLFTESKHLFGLTLFGDDEGENGKTYPLHPMEEPKLELVRQIAQLEELKIQNKLEGGDIFEGIKYSVDMLQTAVGTKKFKKRMFLFTCGEGQTDYEKQQIKMLAEHIQKIGAKVNIIVIDFMEGYDDEKNSIQGVTSLKPQQKKNSQLLIKLKQLCPDNVKILPASIAIELYREFRKKDTNRVAVYRGPFEISPGLSIDIATYTQTRDDKIISLKKYNNKKELNKSDKQDLIQTEALFHAEDDQKGELVQTENIINGYRYGDGFVPITEEINEQIKFKENKGMVLIGFVEKHEIPRQSFMGTVYKVIPGNDGSSQKLFSAFIYSMLTLDRYAICRHVSRNSINGVNPKLVVLIPYKSSKGECFYMTDLPVEEDIREFPFNPLYQSSRTQQQLVDQLIKKMDLMNINDEQDAEQALKVHWLFNPTKQYLYQTVFHRTVNPDNELPSLDPNIREYISPEQVIYPKVELFMQDLKAKFGLKVNEIKKPDLIKKIVWAELIKDKEQQLIETSTVASSADSLQQQAYWKKFNFEPQAILQLDPSDPIQSFNSMISYQKKDLVSKAISEMCEFISHKIQCPTEKQLNGRIVVDCLSCLRKGCIKEKQESKWDSWLQEHVDSFSRQLREQVKDRGLGFIIKSNQSLFKTDNGVLHRAQIKIEYDDLD